MGCSKDRAEAAVRTWIVPTITAAFETYPELDVAEVLELCVSALSGELHQEFREERRQLIHEIRTPLRLTRRAPSRQIKDR